MTGTWNTLLSWRLSQEETSGSGKLSETGGHIADMRFTSFSLCNLSGPTGWQNVTYRNQEGLTYRAGPTCTSQLTVSFRFLPDSPFLIANCTIRYDSSAEMNVPPAHFPMLWHLPKCLEVDLVLLGLTDPFTQASGGHPAHQKETGTGERNGTYSQQAATASAVSKSNYNWASKFSKSTSRLTQPSWGGDRHREWDHSRAQHLERCKFFNCW